MTRRVDLMDMLALSRDFLRDPAKRQALRAAAAAYDAQRGAQDAPEPAVVVEETPAAPARPSSPYRGLTPFSESFLHCTIADADTDAALDLVLPELHPDGIFAGVKTALEFAAGLARRLGLPVRIVLLKPTDQADAIRARLDAFGIGDAAIVSGDEIDSATFSRSDLWVATHWWTAHALDVAARTGRMDASDVVYLIQDYEPGFVGWSTDSAVAESTYRAGFTPVVNSTPVAAYLARSGAPEVDPGFVFAPSFDLDALRETAEARRRADTVRIFFYGRTARPRNMYGLGLAALRYASRRLAAEGIPASFVMAGEDGPDVDLDGAVLANRGVLTRDDYFALLSEVDVGLSLQASPHPSHPPFDLAISGAVSVTNDVDGARGGLHERLRAVEARPDVLGEALVTAARQALAEEPGEWAAPAALGRPFGEVVDAVAAALGARSGRSARPVEVEAPVPVSESVPYRPAAGADDRTAGSTTVTVDPSRGSGDSWASEANRLLSAVSTRHALLLDPAVRLDDDAAAELLRVAVSTGAAFVQPVIVRESGTVVDAGAVFASRGAPPLRLFEGHLPADLPAGESLPARVVVSPAVLVDLAVFDGFAPGAPADVALARASVGSGAVVALRARAQIADADSRRLAASPSSRTAWSGVPSESLVEPTPSAVYGYAGLALVGLAGDPVPDLRRRIVRNDFDDVARRARPILVREAEQGTADESRALRWSIRSGAPLGPEGRVWGDTYFAEDLAAALRERGQQVVIDTRESMVRPDSDHLDDVSIALRGLYRLPTNPAAVNILWVISHPELVTLDEIESYDLVFAAGPRWAERMDALSAVPVRPLLQATSPARFSPERSDPALASDVLFVGKTRNVFRPVVRDAVEAGADLAVYGDGWERFIDPSHIRAEFLDNDRASAAYASARIVLNDHWHDMAAEGFLSNRLFDAVASGARVVTDPIEGLEIFGGAARAYTSVDELRGLIGSDAGWPDREAMVGIVESIRQQHSFGARADVLIEAARETARVLRRPLLDSSGANPRALHP